MQNVLQRVLVFFILLTSLGGYSVWPSSVRVLTDLGRYQPRYGIEVWTPDQVLARVPKKPQLPRELSQRIKGKYSLFLFARAAFCGACNKQLDTFRQAYDKLAHYDLEIVFSTADEIGGIVWLQKTHQIGQTAYIKPLLGGFFTQFESLSSNNRYPHFLLVGDPSLQLAREFGVVNDFAGGDGLAIPSAFILDKEGNVVWVYLTSNHLVDFVKPKQVLAELADLTSQDITQGR